jgi:hypothetical protein
VVATPEAIRTLECRHPHHAAAWHCFDRSGDPMGTSSHGALLWFAL